MWNRHDWALIAVTAAGVFGTTLALTWTPPLNAGDEKPATVEVATPTYAAGVCKVSAAIVDGEQILGRAPERGSSASVPMPGTTYLKPGNLPQLQLIIANPTDAPARATFHAQLQRTSARDLVRRVPLVSPPAWSDDYDLSLKPGEKRIITLTLDKVTTEARDTLTLAVGEKPPAILTNNATPATGAAQQNATSLRVSMNAAANVRLVSMVVSPPGEPQGAPVAMVLTR